MNGPDIDSSPDMRTEADPARISRIVSYLMSKHLEIAVRGQTGEILGRYRLTRAALPGGKVSEEVPLDGNCTIFMEGVLSEGASDRLSASSEIRVEFASGGTTLFFDTVCRMASISGLHVEMEAEFPRSLAIKEARRSPREEPKIPEFISVEMGPFRGDDSTVYTFRVINTSEHGLGVLIPEDSRAFLSLIKAGDIIPSLTLFARDSFIKVEARVAHVTQIKGGREKGNFVMGLESRELIESSRTRP
ncbi:MAG: hypothetical protein COZ70_06110 [Deltaproteobacteria bacterium CG_4_8_14_3_um_filter_51_11]|nr:hypothetical protein [bacterium]OIP43115.1 MAG: hypothetical protein AUK25_02265 [Desulfobacteraceae bacterium CG2_30_51_40]PIP46894.1 MAG: hypothetical protein COX16_07385 [Deltaproteobacteria bacterium CG23_combo_of_CG06-09_8_20_14_all_51_20]PIX19973.1 MAG: hypothetical protein COZ70_06110 [Deltaproteobacteria bacterium CG_4_8_14_3_um_filter_51_11]PIY22058.1 MAG: hypothetical protein COZ11_14105 [Deltaproteobacteria bacterium CG_4_10_14_3_um_filter_51_14]PJB36433.1 MAG: hypothetical prote